MRQLEIDETSSNQQDNYTTNPLTISLSSTHKMSVIYSYSCLGVCLCGQSRYQSDWWAGAVHWSRLHLPLIKLDVPVVLSILIRGWRRSFQVGEFVVASGSASLVPAAVVETLGSPR